MEAQMMNFDKYWMLLFLVCALSVGLSTSQLQQRPPQPATTDKPPEVVTYQYGYDYGSQYHHEKKDSNNVVTGEYGYQSPDGWFRIYNYTADKNGYRVSRRRERTRSNYTLVGNQGQTGKGPIPQYPFYDGGVGHREDRQNPNGNQYGGPGQTGSNGLNNHGNQNSGSGQPTNSHPNGQPTNSYPNGQPTNGYPNGQPTNGYPNGQPTNSYPNGQPTNGYPNGQPTNRYPNGQPTNSYPNGQPTNGYPNGQPTNGYPNGQSGAQTTNQYNDNEYNEDIGQGGTGSTGGQTGAGNPYGVTKPTTGGSGQIQNPYGGTGQSSGATQNSVTGQGAGDQTNSGDQYNAGGTSGGIEIISSGNGQNTATPQGTQKPISTSGQQTGTGNNYGGSTPYDQNQYGQPQPGQSNVHPTYSVSSTLNQGQTRPTQTGSTTVSSSIQRGPSTQTKPTGGNQQSRYPYGGDDSTVGGSTISQGPDYDDMIGQGAGVSAQATSGPRPRPRPTTTKPSSAPIRYNFPPSSGQQTKPLQHCEVPAGIPKGFPDNLQPLTVTSAGDKRTPEGHLIGQYKITFPLGYVMDISYTAYQDPVLASQYLPPKDKCQ